MQLKDIDPNIVLDIIAGLQDEVPKTSIYQITGVPLEIINEIEDKYV